MPEKKHTARIPEKPGAIHDVGLTIEDRLEEFGVFRRVVFEVRVLNDHHVPSDPSQARADRSPFPAILLMDDHLETERYRTGLPRQHLWRGLEIAKNLGRTVRGTVVHDDDSLRDRNARDATENLTNGVGLVVDRNDNREERRRVFSRAHCRTNISPPFWRGKDWRRRSRILRRGGAAGSPDSAYRTDGSGR